MKIPLLLVLGGAVLSFNSAFAQPDLSSLPADRPVTRADLEKLLSDPASSLKQFNLDFPGGTPGELVKAIEKASGQDVNVIIPEEYANQNLPAFAVKNVTVAQVFEAMKDATTRNERYAWTDYMNPNREPQTGSPLSLYFNFVFDCEFKTEGRPTTNSIWSFYCNKPWVQHDPTVCRFFQLGPYLESGYKVEDITSAAETGWKMLGYAHPPQIFYHKDTKMLVVVGEANDMKTVEDVLAQLPTKPKEKSKDMAVDKSKGQ